MKAIKLFALLLVALVGMTACSDGDNNQTVVNTYKGYVYADFFFAKNYYSGEGEVKVKMDNGVYTITLENDRWGKATFEKVAVDDVSDNISGTGTARVPSTYSDEVKEYTDAELHGTRSDFTVYIPSLKMGQKDTEGTTLYFHLGRIPAERMAGTFSGKNSVEIGNEGEEKLTYETAEDIECEITTNKDGTINITMPEYQLTDTEVGNLTLGGYTISDIAFNSSFGTFYCIYGSDGLTEHFKMEQGGQVRFDDDYLFSPGSYISIEPVKEAVSTKVKVVNTFRLGKINENTGRFETKMPYGIVTTFTGTIPSAK